MKFYFIVLLFINYLYLTLYVLLYVCILQTTLFQLYSITTSNCLKFVCLRYSSYFNHFKILKRYKSRFRIHMFSPHSTFLKIVFYIIFVDLPNIYRYRNRRPYLENIINNPYYKNIIKNYNIIKNIINNKYSTF